MIRVGTSGFGYHDWCPAFYPDGLPYEDYLDVYARQLDCCELVQTFFEMPVPSELEKYAERVPQGFSFTVKLHRRLTHETHDREPGLPMARRFAGSLRPLSDVGRLGAIVAQFPFSFVNHPDNRAYLCRLRSALDLPLVAELRNETWRHPETIEFLRGWGIGWVATDGPIPETVPPPSGMATSSTGYVRFHGRNRRDWWNREDASRYDYRYRKRELLSWAPRVREIARHADDVYVVFNNRGGREAAAASNAVTFRRMLTRPRRRSRVPPGGAFELTDTLVG